MFNICSAVCFCVVYSLANAFMFSSIVDRGAVDVGEVCVAFCHVLSSLWRISQFSLFREFLLPILKIML